ncbi:MAG: hypothetical protein C0483_16560 [Pirellula sp.]|nr:hypothetical protein [Pirellula sp.]
MKFLELLSELGILRWGGTAGVYHNALERPIELQQPGVFNAERDLINPPKKMKNVEAETAKPRREAKP